LKICISREVCYRNIPWEYPWDIRNIARKCGLSRSRSTTLPHGLRAARKYNGCNTKYARGRDVTGGSTRTQHSSRRPITQALVTMRF